MSTSEKGAIAEAGMTLCALELGLQVFKPIAEGGRYDLIFDAGYRLLRVQCKWGAARET